MRTSLLHLVVLAALACSGAEPTRPYAAELDPAIPRAHEPDYRPSPDPLKQRVAPAASAAASATASAVASASASASANEPAAKPAAEKGH